MNISLWVALIGVVAGAFGFWFTTFIMQPILRFKNVKNKVLMDFIYYSQVRSADGLNDEMKELYGERVRENRKSSAMLSAAILDLPFLYLSSLKCKKLDLSGAATKLIGFSNTTDNDKSHSLEIEIRRKLGLPEIR